MGYFLGEKLPDEEYRVYRGNLTMPKNATLADHKAARTAFNRAVSRYKAATGHVIRIRCVADFTSHSEMHYDFTLYADKRLGPDRVKSIVAGAWQGAGGRRSTCVPIDGDDEEIAWSKYMNKDTKANDRWRFVPMGGVPRTWGTNGFFLGHRRDELWKEWIKVHFPKIKTVAIVDDVPTPAPITKSKTSSQSEPTFDAVEPDPCRAEWDAKMQGVSKARYVADTPFDRWATDMATRHPDRIIIQEQQLSPYKPPDKALELVTKLPTCREQGIGFDEVVERLGWHEDVVYRLLTSTPGVVCDRQGVQDPATGNWVYNGWYYSP